MNRLNTSFLILTILLSYAACKKDAKVKPEDAPTILSCDLNTPTFSRDINTADTYYDIVEDLGRNILLLGKNHILKYDYQGNLLWSKNMPSAGIPQNIIQADGNNFFTTNSTIEVTPQKYNQFYSEDTTLKNSEFRLTSYWKGLAWYPLPNCSLAYDKVAKNFGEDPDTFVYAPMPVNNSKCFLNKLDKDGNLLWTKAFDGNYFLGKSMSKTGDGNFALATLKISGTFHTIEIDQNGVFQDSVKCPIDHNSITVYKLDKDGSIIWAKTINGILVAGYAADDPLNNLVDVNIHVVSIQNNLFIQTRTKLFVLDENGNIIRSMKPYGNDCGRFAQGLSTFNNLVYSSGMSYNTPPHYGFGVIYDANGNIREQIPSIHSSVNTIATSDGIILNNSGDGFLKVDMNDNKLWGTQAEDYYAQCVNRTCKEGIVFVVNKKGKLNLIKTDRNGLY